MPATEVQHQLTKAGDEFKSAITAAVQGHPHSCATATKEKLSKTNMADFGMAATRAKKGLLIGSRGRDLNIPLNGNSPESPPRWPNSPL